VPRPLHGLLHAIGVALRAPFKAIGSAVNSLAGAIPGGAVTVWIILAAATIAISVASARRYSRRALSEDELQNLPGGEPASAAALERQAALAEREGRWADAVRLRFRAGLARLTERGLITTAASTPTAEISQALHSPPFDALACRFDEIVYGAAPAGQIDAEQARRGWADVTR
jgi:hypothetical protein